VGSTGVVGREVCRLLRQQGHEVRGLVRVTSDPEVVGRLRDDGVEIAVGDLASPSSLNDACAGMDAVVCTATAIGSVRPEDTLAAVDDEGVRALIDAAAAAGVRRFVYVSVLDLAASSPFGQAKAVVEDHLRTSGMHHTIVRPTIFMDTWLSPHAGFDWSTGTVAVYGDGTKPLNWVHSGDVAEVVAATVGHPGAEDAEVPVVGPEALTPREAVVIFEDVTAKAFDVTYVPVEDLQAQQAAAKDPTEASFAALMLRYAEGDPSSVQPLAGLPPTHTTVREYAATLMKEP
jgi:NADH dehydrogenase